MLLQPYFVWNNVDSRAMGVIVSSYPPIIRPPERAIQQTIPGRAGTLILTEGEDVYDAYIKSFVIGLKPGADAQRVSSWLRGSGAAVFGNEPGYRYFGRILAAVQWDKVGSWRLKTGGVQMLTQPYKARSPGEPDFTLDESGNIYNPGDVAARPLITVDGTGDIALSIGDTSLELSDAPTGLQIDCDAGIILTSEGAAWDGEWAGEFLRIAPGHNAATIPSGVSITVSPRWRWI